MKLVDTIDTNGMTVVQMLELNEQYLLAIGHMSNMQVFRRMSSDEIAECDNSSCSSVSAAPGFNLSVDFGGLLSKTTSSSKPYTPYRGPPPLHETEVSGSKYSYVCSYSYTPTDDFPISKHQHQ